MWLLEGQKDKMPTIPNLLCLRLPPPAPVRAARRRRPGAGPRAQRQTSMISGTVGSGRSSTRYRSPGDSRPPGWVPPGRTSSPRPSTPRLIAWPRGGPAEIPTRRPPEIPAETPNRSYASPPSLTARHGHLDRSFPVDSGSKGRGYMTLSLSTCCCRLRVCWRVSRVPSKSATK